MAHQKLKLMKGDSYQAAVAAHYLCDLLLAFLEGRSHREGYLHLGAEQGPKGWDDFVVFCVDATQIHHQVKRQSTPFCTYGVVRGTKLTGKNTGQVQDLSDLDKVFRQLGELTRQPSSLLRRFRLDVLSGGVQIKKGLEVRTLSDVAVECAKTGVTAQSLARSYEDQPVHKVAAWLKNWCGFVDLDHVHRALSLLTVREWCTGSA
jgi:hypothetical protein